MQQHVEAIEAVMRRAFPEAEVDAWDGHAVAISCAVGDTRMLLSAKTEDGGQTLLVEASPLEAFGFSSAGTGCRVTVPLDGGYEYNDTMHWRFQGARLPHAPPLVGALAEIASEYFALEALGSRIAEWMGCAFPEAEVTRTPHMVSLAFQGVRDQVAIHAVLGDFDEPRGPIGVYFAPEHVFQPLMDCDTRHEQMLLGHTCHTSVELPFDFERRCRWRPRFMAVFLGADPDCCGELRALVNGLSAIASDCFFERRPS